MWSKITSVQIFSTCFFFVLNYDLDFYFTDKKGKKMFRSLVGQKLEDRKSHRKKMIAEFHMLYFLMTHQITLQVDKVSYAFFDNSENRTEKNEMNDRFKFPNNQNKQQCRFFSIGFLFFCLTTTRKNLVKMPRLRKQAYFKKEIRYSTSIFRFQFVVCL